MIEWIAAIGHAAGWHGEIIPVSNALLPSHLRGEQDMSQDWVVDTSRIRTELGYEELIPTDEAFKRALVWERANPPKEIDLKQFDYAAEDAVLAKIGKQ